MEAAVCVRKVWEEVEWEGTGGGRGWGGAERVRGWGEGTWGRWLGMEWVRGSMCLGPGFGV